MTRCKGRQREQQGDADGGPKSRSCSESNRGRGVLGPQAAKALNLEPLASRSTEAGCDSCGHVTIEAKEAA